MTKVTIMVFTLFVILFGGENSALSSLNDDTFLTGAVISYHQGLPFLYFSFDLGNADCSIPVRPGVRLEGSGGLAKITKSGILFFGFHNVAVFSSKVNDRESFYLNLIEDSDCLTRLRVEKQLLIGGGWTSAFPDPGANYDLTPLEQEWLPNGKVKAPHLFNFFSQQDLTCPTGIGEFNLIRGNLTMEFRKGFDGKVEQKKSSKYERSYSISTDSCRYSLTVEMFTYANGVWTQARARDLGPSGFD